MNLSLIPGWAGFIPYAVFTETKKKEEEKVSDKEKEPEEQEHPK